MIDLPYSENRQTAMFLALLVVLGLCPYRYTRNTNMMEVWVSQPGPFDDPTFRSMAYTRYIFPGHWLRGDGVVPLDANGRCMSALDCTSPGQCENIDCERVMGALI